MTPSGILTEAPGIRTVGVLVVDTVDSVAMKERLGQKRADEIYRRVERLLRKAISRTGGQTVKGLGDGVLAVFPSASSALRAACSALQGVSVYNRDATDTIALRAGVSVGDVAFEGDDIKGLAVDEAARLQTEAGSNGILLTRETYLLARGRTNCALEQGPELALKGIDRPVSTYTINWAESPEGTDLEVELPDKLAAERRSRFPFAGRGAATTTLGVPVLGEHSSLIILRGPTGIGKTRLLAEWADGARLAGAFIFYCNAETGSRASLQEVATALREFLSSLAHARLLSTSPGYRRACEDLAAAFAPPASDTGLDIEHSEIVERLVRFVAHIADDSPTVLIIDSVQYGSSATLAFMDALLKSSVANVRIVCAVTTDLTSDEVTVSDDRLMNTFPLSEHVQSFDVEPLDLDGVVEWLERQPMLTLGKAAPVELDDIGKEIADAFHEASGGNPNVLGLVIRDSYDLERRVSMDDYGHWRTQSDIESLRRSQSAEKLIRTRLGRLSAEEREILDIAAVVGLEIEGDLLRRVSGKNRDQVNDLLAVARNRHFIAAVDGVERFETEATRRAVYRIMSTPKRADWHEALANALLARADDGKTLVPHVQIARHFSEVAAVHGRHADDAVDHFLRAATRAIRTEPSDAVNLAHEALKVLDTFELVDDAQLRGKAQAVVAEAQEELGHPGPQLSRELTEGLRTHSASTV
ncbi:MAG: hypothetical protein JWL83_1946 [Actinomycetia bacterium]|nr:hypothetical protein [Actinomycetes bacterium]